MFSGMMFLHPHNLLFTCSDQMTEGSSPIIAAKTIDLEKKKKHNLKVEGFVSLGGRTEDLHLGYSISGNSERLLRRGKGGCGQPGYVGIFGTKTR